MNGAESLIRTLVNARVDVCFANPGTTEMPIVRALDEVPGMRAVLGLFEGVCTGAADGYARMAGRPGLTLLHLGPGLANGLAYLHDARRARSPIVNLVGDHAIWHLAADAPLTSDIESLARPVSAWVRRNQSAVALAGDVADAIAAASAQPGQIATLIVPHDCQLDVAGPVAEVHAVSRAPLPSDEAIARAAALLRPGPTALFLGGHALRERSLYAAARVSAATGCVLMGETFPARWERGAGMPVVERLPYFPDHATAALSRFRSVIIAGAKPPVAFFGYPGLPSHLIAQTQPHAILATPEEDVAAALEALAEAIGAPKHVDRSRPAAQPPSLPSGPLNPDTLSAVVAALLPDHAIVMDESNTSMAPFLGMSNDAPRHTVLAQPGGAIGLGPPCATGAAIACPDRRVINLQADGSAMYTLQALWTQAREQLDVTTIICNNRSYRILGIELARAGITPGEQARRLIGLAPPAIDWVHLAKGMGVDAARVETAEELAVELSRALAVRGPRLIEAIL